VVEFRPVPTFLVTADKTKTEITVRAFCPTGYIVELPYLGWTENAPERLQAILNSKCETSRFVRPGDMTPTLTFHIESAELSKEKKVKRRWMEDVALAIFIALCWMYITNS